MKMSHATCYNKNQYVIKTKKVFHMAVCERFKWNFFFLVYFYINNWRNERLLAHKQNKYRNKLKQWVKNSQLIWPASNHRSSSRRQYHLTIHFTDDDLPGSLHLYIFFRYIIRNAFHLSKNCHSIIFRLLFCQIVISILFFCCCRVWLWINWWRNTDWMWMKWTTQQFENQSQKKKKVQSEIINNTDINKIIIHS